MKSTAPKNQLTFRSVVAYIWYLYSNISVGAVWYDSDHDSDLYLCDVDRFDEMNTCWFIHSFTSVRNEHLEHTSSPLSNYFRRRTFSKHSEFFGRILGVKYSRLSYLSSLPESSQNIPNVRKVRR